MTVSVRFEHAFLYASSVHAFQSRRGSGTPYLAHLMSVAALVLEYGGDEDEAIAALLHDAVEDAGGSGRLRDIQIRFGNRVAEIVAACSDTDQIPKPPWRERKEQYIAQLAENSRSALLVSCCDKLHNARSIVSDLRLRGSQLWSLFNGGGDGTLWYYQTLVTEFRRFDVPISLVDELERTVGTMAQLAEQTG